MDDNVKVGEIQPGSGAPGKAVLLPLRSSCLPKQS